MSILLQVILHSVIPPEHWSQSVRKTSPFIFSNITQYVQSSVSNAHVCRVSISLFAVNLHQSQHLGSSPHTAFIFPGSSHCLTLLRAPKNPPQKHLLMVWSVRKLFRSAGTFHSSALHLLCVPLCMKRDGYNSCIRPEWTDSQAKRVQIPLANTTPAIHADLYSGSRFTVSKIERAQPGRAELNFSFSSPHGPSSPEQHQPDTHSPLQMSHKPNRISKYFDKYWQKCRVYTRVHN